MVVLPTILFVSKDSFVLSSICHCPLPRLKITSFFLYFEIILTSSSIFFLKMKLKSAFKQSVKKLEKTDSKAVDIFIIMTSLKNNLRS